MGVVVNADINEELRRCKQAHSDAEQKVEELLVEGAQMARDLSVARHILRRLRTDKGPGVFGADMFFVEQLLGGGS